MMVLSASFHLFTSCHSLPLPQPPSQKTFGAVGQPKLAIALREKQAERTQLLQLAATDCPASTGHAQCWARQRAHCSLQNGMP